MSEVKISVTRDSRGGFYNHEKDKSEFGTYRHEYCDIPVIVRIDSSIPYEPDAPHEGAVAEDQPIYDAKGIALKGQYFLRKGDVIAISEVERKEALTEYWERLVDQEKQSERRKVLSQFE